MNYLKNPNIKIKPIDKDLLNLINFINETYSVNIFTLNVLEVGIGIGHKSIKLSKLFDNYYGLEPIKDIYKICKKNLSKHKSNIKLLNINLDNFIKNTDLKFDLIILENSIHFIDFDNFFSSVKNILNSTGYIIIKNPLARPYGWGNKEFCADSDIFNESKWIKFREQLKTIYNHLDNSPYLVKKIKNNFYHYYLLKL